MPYAEQILLWFPDVEHVNKLWLRQHKLIPLMLNLQEWAKSIIANLGDPTYSLSSIGSQIINDDLVSEPQHELSPVQVQQRVHSPETRASAH